VVIDGDLSLTLGDEAVALAAIHAGISAAFSYPGTPSTEILEYIQKADRGIIASWSANEKTAYEHGLGLSYAGKRVLVSMKHVGLNVAADPFINSALLPLNGGFVLAVADDPGMHSSQNEQDSRFYSDFSGIPCLEPSNQQDAYWMTREAFDLSEKFHLPVMVRLVTNLAHSRGTLRMNTPFTGKSPSFDHPTKGWVLLPAVARKQWRALLEKMEELKVYSNSCPFNQFEEGEGPLGIVTSGMGKPYFMEHIEKLPQKPYHLHIGFYPPPEKLFRVLVETCTELLFIEEGYPLLEKRAKGFWTNRVLIRGKLSGDLPMDGELTPDIVGEALGLDPPMNANAVMGSLVSRPPRLCDGCPHSDSCSALKAAIEACEDVPIITTDIGCYTLAALPPFSIGETCVCMGSSIGIASGISLASKQPAVAMIGDSTFIHSGLPGLIEVVKANSNITVLLLDNSRVGMTGGQQTLVQSEQLVDIVVGLGADPQHVKSIQAHPQKIREMARVIGEEIKHQGVSVIISTRECVRTAARSKQKTRNEV
jgi:indolepyruvate ferredoxin oxidoreductase alpha subunit